MEDKTAKLPDPRKVKPKSFWKPTIYQCRNCRDIIFSKKPGYFAACKCGNYVDETHHYCRMGGSPNALKIIQKGNSSEE